MPTRNAPGNSHRRAQSRNMDAASQMQQTSADFDNTVRQAEQEGRIAQPGQKTGNKSKQHNNGRGGGK